MARKFVINLKLCAHFVPQAEGQAICNLHFDNLCCRLPGNGGHKHISHLPSGQWASQAASSLATGPQLPLLFLRPSSGEDPASQDGVVNPACRGEWIFQFPRTRAAQRTWIDYADCQGHSLTLTPPLTGLQFRFQLDTSCHTLCQLAKDKAGEREWVRRRNHRQLFVQSPAQIDGQCEWRRLITLITAPFIITRRAASATCHFALATCQYPGGAPATDSCNRYAFRFWFETWFTDCHRNGGSGFVFVSLRCWPIIMA